jgi:glycerophosphodiester phosphodiesterase
MDKLAHWIASLSAVNGDGNTKVTPHLESVGQHQHPTAKLSLPSKISRHNLLTDAQNQQFAAAIDEDDTETLKNLLQSSNSMGITSAHDLNMVSKSIT